MTATVNKTLATMLVRSVATVAAVSVEALVVEVTVTAVLLLGMTTTDLVLMRY